MATYTIVAGWTAPLDIALKTRNAVPSGTMAGMTAELILRNFAGDELNTVGDVSIQDSSAWVVRYSPDPADLVEGVYRMRIKITDSGGKVAYFPSGDPDMLVVRPEAY